MTQTDDELRQACGGLIVALGRLDAEYRCCLESPRTIDIVFRFACQQQAETWKKALRKFDREFEASNPLFHSTRDYRIDKYFEWLKARAKAKELET